MSEKKTIFDVLIEMVFDALSNVERSCEKDHFCRLECREYKEQYCC